MELPTGIRLQLRDVLLSAFPRHQDLVIMVRDHLDRNLSKVAGGETHSDVVFSLIEWAQSQGRLEELVAAARDENPGNPKLKQFVEQHPHSAGHATSNTLGHPQKQKLGILIDLSHAQSNWPYTGDVGSIFSVAGERLMATLKPIPEERPWDVRVVTDRGQLGADQLKNWSGLLMAIPHRVQIGAETRDEIVQWVHQGGRLVLMGFELGDRHHETNLNELANQFGIRRIGKHPLEGSCQEAILPLHNF